MLYCVYSKGGREMKEDTTTVTITLPKALLEKVEAQAKKELRSRSGQIASIIKTYFDEELTKQ